MRRLFACRGVFQCTDADDSLNSFLDNCFQHVRRCLGNENGELNLISLAGITFWAQFSATQAREGTLIRSSSLLSSPTKLLYISYRSLP